MSDVRSRPLLLVGGGKMGSALLAGWIEALDRAAPIVVIEPDAARRAELRHDERTLVVAGVEEVTAGAAGTLVLAVKPQLMDEVALGCRDRVDAETLVVSIAAGKTLATFARIFGEATPVVRVMPNTPAAVGRGISALCASRACSERHRATAEALIAAVGETVWLDDEEQMHAVTALSGGGPAYTFLLMEVLASAGADLGLDPNVAMRLACSTVAGSGELARRSPLPAARLRADVTSPGGTTKAALDVLMARPGLAGLVRSAIAAAAQRSRELG